MKLYRLYEVSDGIVGTDILRGSFLSMPHAVLAWWRAFGDDSGDGWCQEHIIVCEALGDGWYGDAYGVREWQLGSMPSVYPMLGDADAGPPS